MNTLEILDAEIAGLIEKHHAALVSELHQNQLHQYQSLDVRGRVLKGTRRFDSELFTGIPLVGRSVVELGCSTGETMRAAAIAGAESVDGIDDNPLAVRLGNLVSLYNNQHNVRIRYDHINSPNLLRHRYDVGIALSNFECFRDQLTDIINNINEMFILEINDTEKGWLNRYVLPFAERFPFWCLYSLTDNDADRGAARHARLLFSKAANRVNSAIFARAAHINRDTAVVVQVDVERSALTKSLFGRRPETRALFIEARERIARVTAGDRDALVRVLGEVGDALDDVRHQNDPEFFGSDSYWSALFKGAREYHEAGAITAENPLLECLHRIARFSEPGMRELLSDPALARQRGAERLAGFLQALNGRNPRDLLIAFNPVQDGVAPIESYKDIAQNLTLTDGRSWYLHSFDGHHRIGACWLAKVPSCNVMFCWTNITGLTTFNLAGLAGPDGDATVRRMIDVSVNKFAGP